MMMDNFYTLHVHARQLCILSDIECKFLETNWLTNVDCMNSPALKEAVEHLTHGKI